MNDLILSDDSDNSFLETGDEIKVARPLDSIDDYYKIDKMSHSRMVNFRQSPRHYLYSLTHFEETKAMILGRAFHALVLEEDKFDDQFYGIDISKRPDMVHGMTSKMNKAWKEDYQVRNSKKSYLSEKDFDTIRRMKDALFLDPKSAELFQEVHTVECSLFWTDPETGIEIKMKLDAMADDFTIDLKSCVDAKPEIFASHAFNMEYHGQGALYRNGRPIAKDKTGKALKMKKGDFYFIACEKEPPYGISVNKASKSFLDAGERLYDQTLSDFNFWRQMGAPDVCYEWRKPFGYSTLDAPYWAK